MLNNSARLVNPDKSLTIRSSCVTSHCTHSIGLCSWHWFLTLRLSRSWHQPPLTVFTRSRSSDIHAETKSLSLFIGFIGSMSLSFSHCTALFFLLRVSPTGFSAEVLMRPLGLYIFHFFHPLWRFFMSFGLACMIAATECSKRGSVAISHSFSFVTCRITSYMCIQTFHFSCLSL